MVFQLPTQVEGATSHWGLHKGGLINFKIMGGSKALFYRAPVLFVKGRGRSRSQSSWRESVPLCEPDKGCCQLPWHFSDGYEPFERYKYSLLESWVQRGLNKGTSRRPPSLLNRLEGFRLALACYSASTADLMLGNMCVFWKTWCLLQSEFSIPKEI